MSFHWLRYGTRRTGIEFWPTDGSITLGFRWSRRVFNAPAGPYFANHRRHVLLDARTLDSKAWRRTR